MSTPKATGPEGRRKNYASLAGFPGSDFTDEEREFCRAIERYKREQRRPFPTWREVLLVVHELGYRKAK